MNEIKIRHIKHISKRFIRRFLLPVFHVEVAFSLVQVQPKYMLRIL